jgi:hypothetical protein
VVQLVWWAAQAAFLVMDTSLLVAVVTVLQRQHSAVVAVAVLEEMVQ